MNKKEKKQWEEFKEFEKDIGKAAVKECDVMLACNNCGEPIGYTDKDITIDYLFTCINCGEKE